MKGRITREHDAHQGYDRVYFEGGSAVTDADLNAGFDAQRTQFETLHKAWIAPAGSPNDGWKVINLTQFNSGGQDFVDFILQTGHYGLDGHILTNPTSYAFSDQPYARSADLDPQFRLTVPSLAEVAAAGAALYDAVVLDASPVAVHVTEDSELDEVAMRSDPATRAKFSPKVRAIRDVAATCAQARLDVLNLLASPNATVTPPSPQIASNGRLQVSLGAVPSVDNPCAPELATGYFGRLNHTIKVKLTAADRFVWGYRNGEELYRATLEDPTTLRLITPFADSALFPVSGQIVELCTWDMSLANGEKTAVPLGRFHAIGDGYAPQSETLTLDMPTDADVQSWYNARLAAGDAPFLFLRFWEPAATPMENGTPTGPNVPLADTGVFLNFVIPGQPDDHWSFSLRVNANDTAFPKRMLEPGGQSPNGPTRYADLLALIHWTVVAGAVIGHVHDCRRRVRPLWKQRDCCTFKVGDGLTSFGDFDRIQDAIDELPHEGGKICLLPGRHGGGARLLNRENITIEGCGARSVILPHDPEEPIFRIEGCAEIILKDMLFLDGTTLAIGGARNRALQLLGIQTRGRGSAIWLVGNDGLHIRGCSFLAEAEPAIIPAEKFPTLRSLAFVGGTGIDIRDSGFRCAASDLTLQSLGGLQIASDSANIRVENNVISGGLGHGLTFGHLNQLKVTGLAHEDVVTLQEAAGEMALAMEQNARWHNHGRTGEFTGRDMAEKAGTPGRKTVIMEVIGEAQLRLDENSIKIATVAAQGCLGIDPTVPQSEPQDDDDDWETYFTAGEISHVHVIDNEISNMGGSGISTPAWNIASQTPFGVVRVAELTVDRNHIHDCCRVAVAVTLPSTQIQDIGFGGIALEYVARGTFSGNQIADIGLDVRTPSAGIYVREMVNGHIHGNELRNIGRIERTENLNISGISGGIIVDQCWPEYGDPFAVPAHLHEKMGMVMPTLSTKFRRGLYEKEVPAEPVPDQLDDFRPPRGAALRIENNAVTVNFGMSLDVRGAGSIHVTDNHLSSLSARTNPLRPRPGAHVNIVNTEVPGLEFFTVLVAIFKLLGISFAAEDYAQLFLKIIARRIHTQSFAKYFDVIQFSDNHTSFETLTTTGGPPALCAVVSPFDIQISDNVLKSLHLDTGGWFHLIGAGYYSTQCYANRFDTRPKDSVLGAALTIGMGNSTYFNHASQPIQTVGFASFSDQPDGNLTP